MGLMTSGALSGLGEGLMVAGTKFADYLARSTLQKEAAEITAQRDKTLAEFRRGEIEMEADLKEQAAVAAEERKRAPFQRAATKAQGLIESEVGARNPVSVDDEGNAMPKAGLRPEEEARLRARAYEEEGLVEAASGMRREGLEHERLGREKERDAALDRDRDLDREAKDREAKDLKEYRAAMLKIQGATEGRLKAGAELDNAVKSIALDNARRVEALRKEFSSASPERKAQITEEVQLLTGKDNDNFLPVALKDELGAVTGYKIFDKKRGRFVDDAAPKPRAGTPDNRPPLGSFLKR